METFYHIPVLLTESVDALVYNPDGVYVDLTFGGGGHSREILSRLSDKGRLIAFDKDTDAHSNGIQDPRFILITHNFKFLKSYLRFLDLDTVHGILGDLGISSHQINTDQRGFAHRFDGPFDMRMDPQSNLTAEEVLETYTEKQLLQIFNEYGEIKNAYKLVITIMGLKGQGQFKTVEKFKSAITSCIPEKDPSKYLSQVFQALRIEVNQEMSDLKTLLHDVPQLIIKEGRLVIISYHSLEDRQVKNLLLKGSVDGTIEEDLFGNRRSPFRAHPHKALTPSQEELIKNPRSRSAKLRIGIKN
jgi:16S rRNA (cytosine1402-N4)-methyltransferase